MLGIHKAHASRGTRRGGWRSCECLEDRRLLAGQPSVSLQAPARVMIGESFEITARFDNADATDAGYGPFVDLYVPANGVDGINGVDADGLTFDSAQYLGTPVTTTVLTFPNSGGGTGSVLHPYAVNNSGAPLSITGPAGDRLIVMQLPFGSFTAAQPAADITIGMSLSSSADLGQLLTLRSRGGFQYGNDALANPSSDPSLLSNTATSATSWSTVAPIEPILMELKKIYLGPEDETATGPNFPRQYTIEVDIANNQTVTNLDITDTLPNNIQIVSVGAILPSGSVTTNPTTPANAPNNRLVVTLPSVLGTTGTNDASVTFTYFVPFRDANSQQVINSVSGDDVTSLNNASALGDWTPTDTGDPGGVNNASVDAAGPEHTLTPKSIAVQKSVTVVNDPGSNGLSAGDTLEYVINFQVSDFFAFQNIFLNDIMSDGQRFDITFSPLLQVVEHGVNSTGSFNAANFSVIDHFTGSGSPVAPVDGTQELAFRVSDELILRTGNGILLGGLVPVGGTGGSDPSAVAFNGGATTGVITFRTTVQENFTDNFPSLDASVDEGDRLNNDITIAGAVLSYTDVSATGQTEADTSAAEIEVPAGSLVKSIYALNGSTTLPSPLRLSPGDEITYRLTLTIPTSDVEDLVLSDYLPLPVLAATEVTTFSDIVSAATPAAGTAKFGPSDTFRSIFGAVPTLSTNAVSNAVSFNYGDFDAVGGTSRVIDILFTVTASDEPFADGLFLTNMARRSQDTTNTGNFINDAIVQIELAMPELQIRKGAVSTDNANDIYTPTTVGPVTFSAPGTAGYRGSATINSTGLAANPINSNVQQLDAGDIVTFAIVVENTGTSRAGAFDIRVRDTLPSGFAVPGTGLNLNVSDGTGAAMGFTDILTGLFDASGGIEITDPGPTAAQPDLTNAGALDEFHATNGRNVLVITYDLQVIGTVAPNAALTNTATLFHYAGAEAGPDFTSVDLTDPATVQIAAMDLAKQITQTSEPTTADPNVAIGEIVTYTSTFTVPEGVANSVQWVDVPDTGFSVVDIVSVTSSSSDVTTSIGTFTDVQNAGSISTNGDSVTLNFGTLTNVNRNDATTELITVVYRVVTLNSTANVRGTQLNNLATVTWTGGADAVSASNATVVEPDLNVTKSIVPVSGQATDIFAVTLDLSHTVASNSGAFNVILTDVLPAGLNYTSGLTTASGLAPSILSQSANTITAIWNSFALGQTSRIQFNVQLAGSVEPSQIITNAATSTWTSLPNSVTTPQSSDPISTERTGSTSDPGGSANDYSDTGTAQLTVTAPVFSKTVFSTNQVSTTGNNVAIGEIVTYRAVVTIPQSTLSTVRFIDTPTNGLAIVDVVSIVADAGIASSLGSMPTIASNAIIPTNGSSLTLDFGTLTNSDTDSNTTDEITIEYRAVVLNTTTNDRGDALDNQAIFEWGGTNSITTNAADLTIVEPGFQISKSLGPNSGQAFDTLHVTVNLSHNGASNTDAFNVAITDALPTGMTFSGNLVATNGLVPTTLTQSGGTISATWDTFALGSTSRIEFDVTLAVGVQLGTNFDNTVNIQWTSLPNLVTSPQSSNPLSTERTGSSANPGGTANDYFTNASVTASIVNPSLSKVLTNSNQSHSSGTNVVIGEIVTYQTTITVPQGTMSAAQWTDTPDLGLAIVDVVSITAPNSITASAGTFANLAANAAIPADGSSVTVNFGTIVNNDTTSAQTETIVITYRAVVLNTLLNNDGTVLDNQALFTWNTTGLLSVDAADLTVVEPILSVTVSNGTPSPVDAGDLVAFTVFIEHVAGSTVDARDVQLTNLVNSAPNHLDYEPGTLTIVPTGGPVIGSTSTAGGDINIVWTEFPLGATATITFQARVRNTAPPLTTLVDSATLQWTSATGNLTTAQSSNPLSVERTGNTSNPGGAANDYQSQDTGSVQTTIPQTDKSVTQTSLSRTGTNEFNAAVTDLVVGEQVTYTIRAILPEGTSPLQIIDQLPAIIGTLHFVDVQVTAVGANLTIPAGRPTETRSDTDLDLMHDRVVLDFGNVVNIPDGVSNLNDVIEVQVTAQVADALDNSNGQTLTNTTIVDYGTGQATSNATVEIVEPVLQIDKSGNLSTGPAGSTVTYTLVVSHANSSTADAYDLTISDPLTDPNMRLVPGSVTTSSGTVTVGNGTADTSITVTAGTLALADTITISFQAVINPDLGSGVAVNNTSNLNWDSFPGPSGRGGSGNDPAVFTTTAPRIDLAVTKVGTPDPVTIGGNLHYTISVTNLGPSTATNVTLVDPLPPVITVTNVTASQGTSNLVVNTLTSLLGTLRPGEQATVNIDATAPFTAQSFTNSANVTASQTDSAPPNNTATQPTTVVLTADLSGRNWVDTNQNGLFDSNESPIPGVQVTLSGINDLGQNVSIVQTSLPNGSYAFTDLRPGTYFVTQTQPTLFIDASDYLGSVGGTIPAKNQFRVTLTPGVDAVDYNFTERGLRSNGIGKRILLRSNLVASGSPTNAISNAALDSIFAQLTRNGNADFDHYGDADQSDYNFMVANLGGTFQWP